MVRISGPAAFAAAAALTGRPRPRAPRLRWLRDPATGARLDRRLVLAFPGPGSFTGEDVVELQLHGSPAVCRRCSRRWRVAGLRPAEPGEFTRRALMNGRLDLAQVEGLGDLIAAETAAQQRQALRLMDGALSRLGAAWGEELVRALALVEASIDFADEDLPATSGLGGGGAGAGRAEMRRELAGSRIAERIRDGFEVALVGPPNVGKSTLLNALAGREAALTSEVAGTTRDVIEVRLDLDGLPLTLLDMAGLRSRASARGARGGAGARAGGRGRPAGLPGRRAAEVAASGWRAARRPHGAGEGDRGRRRRAGGLGPDRRRDRGAARRVSAELGERASRAGRRRTRGSGEAVERRGRRCARRWRRAGGAPPRRSSRPRSCGRRCARLISWWAGSM